MRMEQKMESKKKMIFRVKNLKNQPEKIVNLLMKKKLRDLLRRQRPSEGKGEGRSFI